MTWGSDGDDEQSEIVVGRVGRKENATFWDGRNGNVSGSSPGFRTPLLLVCTIRKGISSNLGLLHPSKITSMSSSPPRIVLTSHPKPKLSIPLYLSAGGFALIAIFSTLLGLSYLVCPAGVSPPLTRPVKPHQLYADLPGTDSVDGTNLRRPALQIPRPAAHPDNGLVRYRQLGRVGVLPLCLKVRPHEFIRAVT